jgi:3-isopropylmalate dehydratase small subunit
MPEPFITLTGVAAPLLENDINTDQVAPVMREHRSSIHADYARNLFYRRRFGEDGKENPDFLLNQPAYRQAKILVTGDNFGCGSSRESAVWAMTAYGIRCVVARSFADIYRENCLKNGLLPVTFAPDQAKAFEALVLKTAGAAPFDVDLTRQIIRGPDGSTFKFDIAPGERTALLEGLDDIGLTLKHRDEIANWEQRVRGERPWLQDLSRS